MLMGEASDISFGNATNAFINNLLTASLGNLDLLLQRPEFRSNREARELVAGAVAAGRRMAELTHQVLTFAGKAHRRLPARAFSGNAVIVRGMPELVVPLRRLHSRQAGRGAGPLGGGWKSGCDAAAR